MCQGLTQRSKSIHIALADFCFFTLGVLRWWDDTCVAEEKKTNVAPEYRRI